jgi:hypothetical protein
MKVNELGDRRLHHWSGQDRKADINTLADAIAAVGELFNHGGRIVRLDQGKLAGVNLADLRAFIDQHIAAVELVNRGTANKPNWQREYYS